MSVLMLKLSLCVLAVIQMTAGATPDINMTKLEAQINSSTLLIARKYKYSNYSRA